MPRTCDGCGRTEGNRFFCCEKCSDWNDRPIVEPATVSEPVELKIPGLLLLYGLALLCLIGITMIPK